MSLKDFQNVGKLGQGAYSTVYKVIRASDKQTYALKKIKLMSLTPKQKQNALNEIRILASIEHPNIVGYKQAFFDENSKALCIVMEYANEGDLGSKIESKKNNKGCFFEQEIWQVISGILRGLNRLHKIGVNHRDIKPANIFMTRQGKNTVPKIGDLNVSKISQNNMCMTQTGTPYYASPQVWKDQPYNEKSDIWSLGCVIYEMITLKPPFQAQDMEGLYKKVTRGIYPRIPSEYSNDLVSIIRSMLQVNPDSRPSCEKLLKTPKLVKYLKIEEESKENNQLMRTIKGQNFNQLNQMLPKPNYKSTKNKKQKSLKVLMNQMDQKFRLQKVESNKLMSEGKKAFDLNLQKNQHLSKLSKEKLNKKYENTDRIYMKDKQSLNLITRDRKKSEMSIARPTYVLDHHSASKHSVHNIIEMKQANEVKLPKVQNRYNKIKERLNKQNSLRVHKIFND